MLQQHGIEFEEYRYLDIGISQEDIELLVNLEDVIRLSDISDKSEYDLSSKTEIRRLLQTEPKSLQRPILISNGKAVIGRPPENILTLLHGI